MEDRHKHMLSLFLESAMVTDASEAQVEAEGEVGSWMGQCIESVLYESGLLVACWVSIV